MLFRWNDFEANISTSFRELRDDSEFFDVSLCCDNGTDVVQAHKVILAACSPLFRKILARQKQQQHPFLYLKGIRLKELQAVLNFMYHGEVNVAQDSLNGFLAVAEELAVKGLTTDGVAPDGGSAGGAERKKAVAKRKSGPAGTPASAKKAKTSEDDSDVKRIKDEPGASGSGAAAGGGGDDLEDTFDDNGDDFGTGGDVEEFDSFGQYGEGEFDDSSSGMPGGSGGDGNKGRHNFSYFTNQFAKLHFENTWQLTRLADWLNSKVLYDIPIKIVARNI